MFSGGRVKDGWNYSKMNAPAARTSRASLNDLEQDVSLWTRAHPGRNLPVFVVSITRGTGRVYVPPAYLLKYPPPLPPKISVLVNAEKTVWISRVPRSSGETETLTNEVLKGDFHRLIKNRLRTFGVDRARDEGEVTYCFRKFIDHPSERGERGFSTAENLV